MSVQNQIIDMFKSLPKNEKEKLMQELSSINKTKDTPKNEVVEICPYCSSGLIVKHGNRNSTQRYKCKVCLKTFTFFQELVIKVLKKQISSKTIRALCWINIYQ